LKKSLALLLAFTLFALSACFQTATPPAATTTPPAADVPTDAAPEPAAAGKEYTVGVCIYQFNDNFMTLYRQELQRYLEKDLAAKTGNTFKVTVMDGKNDQAEQTNQINNFITQGVDILIVNPVQASSGQQIVDLAKAADIPIVLINREPAPEVLESYDKATYVGADARQSGTYQGEIVRDTPNKGDINGDGKISYIMIMGDVENVDAQYRTEYSIKALEDANLTVERLGENLRGDWDQAKGGELAATALQQYGEQVEVIFCNNDGMALGAKQSIEGAGRKINEDIYLVGVDALGEVVDYVAANAFTGTVFNDHLNQAGTAANVAMRLLNGASVENVYPVPYIKIRPDNAATYLEDAKSIQQDSLNSFSFN
jgi:methyl-galactoside transport system substrate-binding protein